MVANVVFFDDRVLFRVDPILQRTVAFADDPCDCCEHLPCAELICTGGFPATREVVVGGFTGAYEKFNGRHTLQHFAGACFLRKEFPPPNPIPAASQTWYMELQMTESFSGGHFTMIGFVHPVSVVDPIYPTWTHHPGILGQVPQDCHNKTALLSNLMQLVNQPSATFEVV